MDLMSLYQLAINSGVASPLATRKVHVHGRLKTISTLRLVNPLAPRKGLIGKFSTREVESSFSLASSESSDSSLSWCVWNPFLAICFSSF
ncbi:hypothetical protein Tco_1079673 [Tanacetum coccineum]|uniref:Uncharacterized protein n=1 Tax=Tanacetum coccineum TaxID=301880 RepID=A0ABQ5HSJ6_9ASTR